jgi:hypothetical protein
VIPGPDGIAGRVVAAGQAVVRAGLLIPIAGLAGQGECGGVPRAGLAGLARREQNLTQADKRAGLASALTERAE